MENLALHSTQGKIVPLTRKKLLAQALIKDSPVRFPIKNRKFSKHSANSSFASFENTAKPSSITSHLVNPLQEKDINTEESLLRKQFFVAKTCQKHEIFDSKIKSLQEFLIKLWKCHKMGLEIDNLLRFEIERIYFDLQFHEDQPKLLFLVSELKGHILKQDGFPDYLYPYLEEILSSVHLDYPLIVNSMPIFEAETLLTISIFRLNTKKIKVTIIQALRKIQSPSNDMKSIASAFLLLLSEIDLNLQDNMKKFEDKIWDLFIEYTQNSGQVVQYVRKLPECCRNYKISQSNFYIETVQKAQNFFKSVKIGLQDCAIEPLAQFLSEIFEFNKITVKAIPQESKTSRIKRLNRTQECLSTDRLPTPHRKQAEGYIKLRKKSAHSQSFSKILKKNSQESERRLQFLQESRFNKRIIESLTESLTEKMMKDPEYLVAVRQKNQEKYLMFKEEYIDIHKESWIQECVKEVEESEMLKISKEEDLKLIDAKKEAFFAYVCNSQLMKSVMEKVKGNCLR